MYELQRDFDEIENSKLNWSLKYGYRLLNLILTLPVSKFNSVHKKIARV